jgi:hypothetical protein
LCQLGFLLGSEAYFHAVENRETRCSWQGRYAGAAREVNGPQSTENKCAGALWMGSGNSKRASYAATGGLQA